MSPPPTPSDCGVPSLHSPCLLSWHCCRCLPPPLLLQDETPELMPLTHVLATKLGHRLTQVRKDGTCAWLRPDGKTQVTVEYKKADDGAMVPIRVHTILISTQHSPDVSNETIHKELMEHVIKPVVPEKYLDDKTIFHLNPSGEGRGQVDGPAW